MSEHWLAGRTTDPARHKGDYDPWVSYCTCGLAFFSRQGRERADLLWEEHREREIVEDEDDHS
jgi:hypothetical protein